MPLIALSCQVYEDFAVNVAAMPVVAGRKSRIESFAGANCTYTIEAMMGDKKALQAGTSHNLGDNFAKAFNTRYLDEAGALQYVHQSSWGVSTRMVGGIIMTHGDDAGLRLPPRLAPTQVGGTGGVVPGRRHAWVLLIASTACSAAAVHPQQAASKAVGPRPPSCACPAVPPHSPSPPAVCLAGWRPPPPLLNRL